MGVWSERRKIHSNDIIFGTAHVRNPITSV